MSNKLMTLNKRKVPEKEDKNNYLGIEIEFLSSKENEVIKKYLLDEGLEKYCQLGTDNSIKCDTKKIMQNQFYYDYIASTWTTGPRETKIKINEGWELRILIKEKELDSVLFKVGNVLKKCQAKVNNSCGLHVHIDMRNRNPINCANKLFAKQKEIFSLVAKNRIRNTYCRPVKSRNILDILLNDNGDLDKYKAINITTLSSKRTIEIRAHEGTVNCQEIINWCRFLLSLLDKRRLTKGVKKYVSSKRNRKENHIINQT